MDLSLFDYTLPKSLIAQEPSTKRSDAKLLVYDRKKESISHAQFKDCLLYTSPSPRDS